MIHFRKFHKRFIFNSETIKYRSRSPRVDNLVVPGGTLAKARAGKQQIADKLQKAEELMLKLVDDPVVANELIPLKEKIKSKFAPIANALAAVDKAEADLPLATGLDKFFAVLGQFGVERLQELSEVQTARRIVALRPKFDDVAEQLLMPDNAEAWKAFKENPKADLYPGELQPEEVGKILVLRDDKNLDTIYHYQLPAGVTSTPAFPKQGVYFRTGANIFREITSPSSISYHFTGSAFLPAKDSERADFVPSDFSCKSSTVLGDAAHPQGELAAECALFRRLEFKNLVDEQSNKFKKSVLPMLDLVCTTPNISPLFRAYLHYQLLELVKVRPQAWGVQWVPAVLEHHEKLKDLGAVDLRSGDWMVPARADLHEKKFAEFYNELAGFSCQKPVRSRQVLTQKAFEAGFAFAGLVGVDGNPALRIDAETSGELWGLAADSSKLARLYTVDHGKPAPVAGARPQPLTPLFIWKGDHAAILRDAAKTAGVTEESLKAATTALPPLFR